VRNRTTPGSEDGDDGLADIGGRRYRDTRFNAIAVKVLPGEHYITKTVGEMLVTVLGSCISACIRDPVIGVGGMNHFMLPESPDGNWGTTSAACRYGNFAMEQLINDILKAGGRKDRLEIKIFGGANVLAANTDIGGRNSEFIETYLAAEGLPIAASHLRGKLPRRIHYFPQHGKVFMLELGRQEEVSVVGEETRYKSRISREPVSGSVDLFD